MGRLERLVFAAQCAMALWLFERRCHPQGTAVCLLSPRPGRIALCAVAIVAAAVALGTISPLADVVVAAAVCASCLPTIPRAVRALPSRRWRHRASPPRPYLYLHSLASTKAGSGAELVRSVCAEADVRGTTLVLEAANQELVGYYSKLGFRTKFDLDVRGQALKSHVFGRVYPARMFRAPAGKSRDT